MKKLLQSLFVLMFIAVSAMAQNRTITGTVTSKGDGQPIPGVSVKLVGAQGAAVTGADGQYTIKVTSDVKTLLFSSIGYAAKTVSIGGSNVLNITLDDDSKLLEEVVVTGFGLRQAKKDVTGSTSTISGKDIENMPVQSVDRAMQGKLAGVQVTSTSGIPGAAINVRIRGIGSINAGNSPLYVVDGVQVNSGDFTSSTTSANALSALNPDDIESLTVLKDASAAAIYGASGANGVVIITTKRGKNGKTQINVSSYIGYNDFISKPKLLNSPQWIQLSLEAYANRYGATSTQYTSFYNTYVTPFGSIDNVPTYDWLDAVSQKGRTQNYDVNARGGNEKTQFYLGGNYSTQKGQVIGTDFSRGSIKVNLDHKATDRLDFSTSMNLSTITQNTTSGAGAFANISRTAQLQSPNNAIYNPDGSYNTNLPGAYDSYNVLQIASINLQKATTNQFTGSGFAKYKIFNDLNFRSSYGVDYLEIVENTFNDPRFGDGRSVNGSASAGNTRNTNFQTDQTLNYTKTFAGVHNLNVIVGFNYRSEVRTYSLAASQGFPSYQFTQVSSGSTPTTTTGSYTTFRTAGYFAKADYNYMSKYYLSGTVRYDGSSRFGNEHTFGWFPAGAVSYRISQEDFMKDVSFISDLKLRASYGTTGNQAIGNFDSRALYAKSGDYVTSGTGSTLGSGLAPSNLANPLLAWERATTLDVALEFNLFKDRISGTIGYYNKINSNLLLDQPLPLTSGFSTIRQNVGKMRNRGFEFELSTLNIKTDNFSWRTDANIALNRNKILALLDGQTLLGGNFGIAVDRPINSVYTYTSAGVNPADGRAMWYDGNGNITYTQNPSTDRSYIGDLNPKYTGGLTNTINYKGISLSAFFQFSYGNLVLNQDKFFFERSGSTVDRNQYVSNLDRWTTPGQFTGIPKPYFGGTVLNIGGINHSSSYATSDRFYEDGSYIRLKTISLGYDLPKQWLSSLKLRSVRVYAQGLNLWTITKYQGVDPEFVNTSGDFGQYPQFKNYTVGINVGF
ncbi:TonB-linked SusC/RagA family outer membrane protein [Pedobacter sp. W3I1]|uniref:SusC/RagA family TonB-linked outer membrane protein n=1 Tax=Pedobacter sp. W3I1 TaxID=3042291 RepID=UPI0027842FDA|nr:TonB-dependent receptor [Pedobacter sp. W3I1]MDQ0636847.1 TonB-linked SusC/RagA family outer membrane protein [Pedobacter sp. W3I1]